MTVAMSSAAYEFGAGHRLRLQVAGGAHPRFARNTGTGEPIATATGLVPGPIEVRARPGQRADPAGHPTRRRYLIPLTPPRRVSAALSPVPAKPACS